MLDYTTGVQQKPYSPDRIETEVIQLTESHFIWGSSEWRRAETTFWINCDFSLKLMWRTWKVTYSWQDGGQYRGADKSLARRGRKQATATKDFDFHISYL